MKGKRARNKTPVAPPAPARVVQRTVSLSIDGLEIARGHDGLLRGAPEPVLVVGLCERVKGKLAAAERAIVRFPCPQAIPGTVRTPEPVMLRHRRKMQGDDVFVAFVCALEEDSGAGVARVYELLAEPEGLLVYGPDEQAPDPRTLGALLPPLPWPGAPSAAAEVVLDGRSLAELTAGDDLLGAYVVGLPPGETWLRLRFLDRPHRNDWTAALRISAKP